MGLPFFKNFIFPITKTFYSRIVISKSTAALPTRSLFLLRCLIVGIYHYDRKKEIKGYKKSENRLWSKARFRLTRVIDTVFSPKYSEKENRLEMA